MSQDDVIDKKNPEALKKVLETEADFDEEEAYYELCEIIATAQQTGDYVRFQNDLNQWKKHYPIESFSEEYKSKIKYMLSEKFLDSILKDYLVFERCSKMDPSKQLDKLRRIYTRAKEHKDAKKLDADLAAFYKDYPLKYLKEKFPHIIARLNSNGFREKILQKFDSNKAYDEFSNLIYNAKGFSSFEELEDSLKPLKEKYPLEDFSPDYRSKLEDLLKEDSLKEIVANNGSLAEELKIDELTSGTVINLEDESQTIPNHGILNQKTAYFELLEIMKNPNNVNGVFDWAYTYMKYIGKFDDYHKGLILSALLPYYKFPKQKDYSIPIMKSKSNHHLSFDEYSSIDDIKKTTVLQFLAIVSTDGGLSNNDIERLETVHSNSKKAEAVDRISNSLDLFIQKNKNVEELTLTDTDYFQESKQKNDSSEDSSDSGGLAYQVITEDNQTEREFSTPNTKFTVDSNGFAFEDNVTNHPNQQNIPLNNDFNAEHTRQDFISFLRDDDIRDL